MEVNYGMVIIYFLWLQRIGAQENYAIGLIVSFLCCSFFSKIKRLRSQLYQEQMSSIKGIPLCFAA
jgi:hypothetical protein